MKTLPSFVESMYPSAISIILGICFSEASISDKLLPIQQIKTELNLPFLLREIEREYFFESFSGFM